MRNIHCLNNISAYGTDLLTDDYQLVDDLTQAEGVLVRSAALHDTAFPESLQAIARAGAGVNNIPLDRCAEEGIVVFNTPGANANAVKEIVVCGLMLGSRDIAGGIAWCRHNAADENIAKAAEKAKKAFAGREVKGKKLGVIGLGAIGAEVANIAIDLGMDMYGGILEKQLIDRSYPEKLKDDAFMAGYRLKHHTKRLGEPEPEVVQKEGMPQIRPKGKGIACFAFDGIVCSQKVGRHETGGAKEIWEFAMDKGICVEWDAPHPDWDLYVVKEGRVEVSVLGETFTANARDILHVPPYTSYSMKILDDRTVLHAYNVKALGLRLAEIVEKKLEAGPDLAGHWDEVKDIFRQNKSCITKISRV